MIEPSIDVNFATSKSPVVKVAVSASVVVGFIVKPVCGLKLIEPLAAVLAVIVKMLPSSKTFLTTVPFASEIVPSSL